MSARDEAIEIITRDPESSGGDVIWATDLVEAIEREHAHELAEKVRARYPLRYTTSGDRTDTSLSADLIDPEVRS